MNPHESALLTHKLKSRFGHISADCLKLTIAANTDSHSRAVAKLERDTQYAPLETAEVQEAVAGRFFVRVTSHRKRLLDEDNLCEKYHVDCLRYAGLIPSDAPDQTHIEVGQIKSKKEQIEIIIERS